LERKSTCVSTSVSESSLVITTRNEQEHYRQSQDHIEITSSNDDECDDKKIPQPNHNNDCNDEHELDDRPTPTKIPSRGRQRRLNAICDNDGPDDQSDKDDRDDKNDEDDEDDEETDKFIESRAENQKKKKATIFHSANNDDNDEDENGEHIKNVMDMINNLSTPPAHNLRTRKMSYQTPTPLSSLDEGTPLSALASSTPSTQQTSKLRRSKRKTKATPIQSKAMDMLRSARTFPKVMKGMFSKKKNGEIIIYISTENKRYRENNTSGFLWYLLFLLFPISIEPLI